MPEGWEPGPGMTVGPDGTHATFAESRGEGSRMRMVSLGQGQARTVVEAPFTIVGHDSPPDAGPGAVPARQRGLWLVNSDGRQNRQLKLAPGGIGPANWTNDGRTLLYLNFPEDKKQLNTIREHTPDTNTDKLVAKTSQFGHFGVQPRRFGLRGRQPQHRFPRRCCCCCAPTRREFTLCEHKSQHRLRW